MDGVQRSLSPFSSPPLTRNEFPYEMVNPTVLETPLSAAPISSNVTDASLSRSSSVATDELIAEIRPWTSGVLSIHHFRTVSHDGQYLSTNNINYRVVM